MVIVRDSGRDRLDRCVSKAVGADVELGNSRLENPENGLLDWGIENGSGHAAAQALLREIDGVCSKLGMCADGLEARAKTQYSPHSGEHAGNQGSGGDDWTDPQDIGRKFLPSNGGCVYEDLGHLEVCTPEVVSALDFVASWHAMLRIARYALAQANAKCPPGQRFLVLVNASDGLGHAYGSHLSFLVTRSLWDDLFTRRLHPDLFVLAAYLVSSVVISGQGKVGAENGRPPAAYQIAQRADHFDRLLGPQTTYNRPIVNSRDEPLCGSEEAARRTAGESLARLHCIFHDSTLCQVGTLLKVGAMQIVLAMLEARRLDASLMLEDPVAALVAYSHDPGLRAPARLADGRAVSAVDLQAMFCEHARAFVDTGGCDGQVPGASDIVALWEDTLAKLACRDFQALAGRLDWVSKYVQIEHALTSRGLDWSHPAAKHLDHIYASLDLDEGLYWSLERAGLTVSLVDDARIERFRHTPPEDTRAWSRAMLLRHLPRERIQAVDWDRIVLAPTAPGLESTILYLPDPLGDTRAAWFRAAEGVQAQ